MQSLYQVYIHTQPLPMPIKLDPDTRVEDSRLIRVERPYKTLFFMVVDLVYIRVQMFSYTYAHSQFVPFSLPLTVSHGLIITCIFNVTESQMVPHGREQMRRYT